MKRNVKDTYNSPNDPVADPGCQIWLGGGLIQTLKLRGEGGLKKNFQPFGLQFRLKGCGGFKGPPGPSSGSATGTPLEGWFEMAIGH